MRQQILTFHDFEHCEFQEQPFVLPAGYRQITTRYSMISPGTELFCIAEAIESQKPVQPGYILCGDDEFGKSHFLFCSLANSHGCHCNIRAVDDESLLIPLPAEAPCCQAGFLRFINIGLHALNRLKNQPKNIAVIGLGPIGNLAAQSAQLLGHRVTAADLSANRRDVAQACGIANTLTFEELAQQRQQYDYVIDTVAASATLRTATDILRDGGQCSMVGIVKNGPLLAAEILREIWRRGLVFHSGWEMLNPLRHQPDNSCISTEENLYRAIDWVSQKRYQLEPLLSGIVPAEISQIQRAYTLLKTQPDQHICFVIRWQ